MIYLIIAVDFDGILCRNNFPDIGAPNYEVISLVRQIIDKGHEVILWTTRNGEELIAAVEWCRSYGLVFDNVNGPARSNREEFKDRYPTESRKIYADIYIDDHNLEYQGESSSEANAWLVNYLKKGLKSWKTKEN